MKVYISCHDSLVAKSLAEELRQAGHQVVSDWHEENAPRPDHNDVKSWLYKAIHNLDQIRIAERLILVSGTDKYPGGKFVEAGYAYACGVHVIVLGRRENGMVSLFGLADDVPILLKLLGAV